MVQVRSIVVDKNGIVLAGNKTQESALAVGIEDVIEVETDGSQLVVVRRKDLDSINDPQKAKEYALADNRTAEVGLQWDAARLAQMRESMPEVIERFFNRAELIDSEIMPPDFQPSSYDEQPRLDQKKPIVCPHCGMEFVNG